MFSRIEKNPEYKKQQKETKIAAMLQKYDGTNFQVMDRFKWLCWNNRVNRPTGNFDVKYSGIMNNAMTMWLLWENDKTEKKGEKRENKDAFWLWLRQRACCRFWVHTEVQAHFFPTPGELTYYVIRTPWKPLNFTATATASTLLPQYRWLFGYKVVWAPPVWATTGMRV